MRSMISSPLSTPGLVLNYTSYLQHEQSLSSSDDCNYEIMPVIADVRSIDVSKCKRCLRSTRTSMVNYGPIRIRKRHTAAPTLATGRRSKDDLIEGEDIIKRERRRMKNRESARNLKKMRDNIEYELENQVKKLESEEYNLSKEINTLQIYKQYLEEQCREKYPIYDIIARTASAVLLEFKRQQALQNNIEEQLKPPSPSPQWELLFHI